MIIKFCVSMRRHAILSVIRSTLPIYEPTLPKAFPTTLGEDSMSRFRTVLARRATSEWLLSYSVLPLTLRGGTQAGG